MGKAREFWLVKYRRLSLCHSVLYLPPIEPKDYFEVKHVIEKSAYQKAVDASKEISYIGFDCIHCEMKNGVVCEEHLFDNARIATEALKELGEL
nr:hypothetical protein CKG001_10590 [Bdellovibrio sp. CKG001]